MTALLAVFLLGVLPSILVPMLQTRLMDVAHEGQSLAAALNHSTLNIANALGAWLGSVVLAAGYGYEWPSRIGAGSPCSASAAASRPCSSARAPPSWRDPLSRAPLLAPCVPARLPRLGVLPSVTARVDTPNRVGERRGEARAGGRHRIPGVGEL